MPDLLDLIGEEGTPDEQARLRRVHDLLAAADAPPELPRSRQRAPRVGGRVLPFRRPRIQAALAAAAAAVAVAFGVGYLVGSQGGFSERFERPMHGVGSATGATAALEIAALGPNGNWPL